MGIDKKSKIYIAGHRGMVGSAIWQRLEQDGYSNLLGKTSQELDLSDQQSVRQFFAVEKPEVVVDAAARVGGILANDRYPYAFLMDNLIIQHNLIDTAVKAGIQNFVFLGSSCIYPKHAEQPMQEEALLTGPLEPTNQWYAIAKISGVKATEAVRKEYGYNYVSLMPTNLYGPRDNFDLETSHVLPAMLRKFHQAAQNGNAPVQLWGSGKPMREFLHVNDVALAVVFALEHKLEENLYNVGSGKDISIAELAATIQTVTGHKGEIQWDSSKPDGTPRKLMDVSKLQDQGWEHRIGLEEGIAETYRWFIENQGNFKEVKLKARS